MRGPRAVEALELDAGPREGAATVRRLQLRVGDSALVVDRREEVISWASSSGKLLRAIYHFRFIGKISGMSARLPALSRASCLRW